MSNWFDRLDAKYDLDFLLGIFGYALLFLGLTMLLWRFV